MNANHLTLHGPSFSVANFREVRCGLTVVGTLMVQRPKHGWYGSARTYHFTPNLAGDARGLRGATGRTVASTLLAAQR